MAAVRLLLFAALALIFRAIEVATSFRVDHQRSWVTLNLKPLYAVADVNIPIGLGSIALTAAAADSGDFAQGDLLWIMFLLGIVIVGCLFRGFGSRHEPLAPRWGDKDWRYGVVVPNMLAGAVFLMSIGLIVRS